MKLAIIFDFDGVIVDSLEVWGDAFISVCNHHGYGHLSTQKAFLDLFDGNMHESMQKAGISEVTIQEMIEKLVEDYASNMHKVELFKGIDKMLLELAGIGEIYVVSSNFTDLVQNFWNSHRLAKCEEILGGDKEKSKVKKIEGIGKKLPDHEALYIGDTKGDMIEGKLAGAKTVAVTWGWHSAEKLKEGKPDYVVKTPDELVLLTKKILEI
jgi:phosphoglycolate phosphatase